MSEETKVTLYDITSVLQDKAWSPNTWRTRYVLNLKGIPYQTRWLLHPEIERELKGIGAPPTIHWILKTETYTLPAIYDHTNATAISDSNKIARYLEQTYPQTRPLRVAESLEFVDSYGKRLNDALFLLLAAQTAENLVPETRQAWREKRERAFGMRLEALAEPDERRDMLLTDVLGVLSDIDAHSNSKGESPYIQDDEVTYRDVVTAATLTWARRVAGVDSDVYGLIMEVHGGRWKWLMDRFAEWEVVDGVEVENGVL
ncbi:unnamed protein product [Peniophora sp. CBMAI 1063]|nr:unnamed protein product [Peniophora sp. CBMAI 1063]